MIYDHKYKRILIIIDKIWSLNPVEPAYHNITESGWSSSKTAAVVDQNLYVVAANFWQVNLTQKDSYVNLIENFALPKAIVSLGNYLYGFCDGQILLIDCEFLSVTEIQSLYDSKFGTDSPIIKNGVVSSRQFKIFHGLHESGDLVQYIFS